MKISTNSKETAIKLLNLLDTLVILSIEGASRDVGLNLLPIDNIVFNDKLKYSFNIISNQNKQIKELIERSKEVVIFWDGDGNHTIEFNYKGDINSLSNEIYNNLNPSNKAIIQLDFILDAENILIDTIIKDKDSFDNYTII